MDRPVTPMERLLHRWFVQYNPIYLVSAMLVLGGTILIARGLAHEGSLYGPLGVALVAEVYACALVGGAALLARIGQQRPAVLLALLTVLYQGDLTLHTETCAFLGAAGIVASLAWVVVFGAKLLVLGRALSIRIERRTLATAMVGAGALALGPFVHARLDATRAGAALAVVVFVIGRLAPRTDEAVTSLTELDAWGRTVLRRCVRATLAIWTVLFALHVLFWSTQRPIQLFAVAPAFVVLFLGQVRSEARVWGALAAALVGGAFFVPNALWVVALLSAVVLVHRAYARIPAATAARARLVSGAIVAMYLAAWTVGWQGLPLPDHSLTLDASFVGAALVVAWRIGARALFGPVSVTCVHGAFASGLVPTPRTMLEWGGTAVAFGFVLLGASLATSYRLRHVTIDRARP